MKIVDFQIENIGVHKSTKLDLTKVPHDLVMINGYNNYGKTTLLDGLRFCLFDQDITPDLLSNSVEKRDLKVGASMPITVRVKLELADKSVAIIERKQFFTKQDDGLFVPSSPESVLTVNLVPRASNSGDVDFKTADEAERWLAAQFPPKFMNFILFNGEEMEKFLNPKLRKTVEEVVVQSARLEHFNNVRNLIIGHREELQKQAQKILRSSGGNSQDDVQTLQDDLDELERKQSEDEESLENLEASSIELERALSDSEEGKKLVLKHSGLVEEIRIAENSVKEIEAGLRQQTWVAGVNSFFELRLKDSLAKEVREAQINGMYPARFAKDALESIIRDGQCICGTRVHGDKDALNHIQDLISLHDQAGPIGQGLQAVEASLQRVSGRAGEARRTHRAMTRNLNKESAKLDRLEKDLKSLLSENPELDSETSSTKTAATSEFKRVVGQIEKLNRDLKLREVEINSLKSRVASAKEAQSASLEREGKSKDLAKSLKFIDRVIDQSKGFSEIVLTGVREEITLYINEKFSSTVGGNYKTVVNPDFSVVCLNDDGSEAKISKGQEMLRAYFFAFALRKVAGMQFPLIVDSPKGRLDGRNSGTVIESIAELIKGETESQMLFFMIDDECTPDVRGSFLELGATEYHLKFQEKPYRRSTIEVGMDPEWVRHGVWKVWAENEALKKRVGNA